MLHIIFNYSNFFVYKISTGKKIKKKNKDISIPFACNSSREKQLPIDSGRVFNLLFDTFKSDNCIIKH